MNLRTIAEELTGGHYYDDSDCWYSCPLNPHGCCDDAINEDACTCSLEERIERNRKVLEDVYKAGVANEPLEG